MTLRDAATLDLAPIARTEGEVALPGSKSISNRTLLLSALARGTTVLEGLLDADDTAHMVEALRVLGVAIDRTGTTCVVHGVSGAFPNRAAHLYLGNAGTAVRPLTAALAMQGGDYAIAGVPRMNALGYCYRNGLGFRQDDAQAANWFRRAADRGHVAAMSIRQAAAARDARAAFFSSSQPSGRPP